jgi:hypothetical protein
MFPNDPDRLELLNTICLKCEKMHFIKAPKNYTATHKCKNCDGEIEFIGDGQIMSEIDYNLTYPDAARVRPIKDGVVWCAPKPSKFSGQFIFAMVLLVPGALLVIYLAFSS